MMTAPELARAELSSSLGHSGGGQWRKKRLEMSHPPRTKRKAFHFTDGEAGGGTWQDQDLNVHPGLDASFQTFPSSTFHRLGPSPDENGFLGPKPRNSVLIGFRRDPGISVFTTAACNRGPIWRDSAE